MGFPRGLLSGWLESVMKWHTLKVFLKESGLGLYSYIDLKYDINGPKMSKVRLSPLGSPKCNWFQ